MWNVDVSAEAYQNLGIAGIEQICGPGFLNDSIPNRVGSPLNAANDGCSSIISSGRLLMSALNLLLIWMIPHFVYSN